MALVGLICIGLMGLAGVLFYTMSSEAQEEVAVLPTPTPIPPTPSPTSTETATPTETPLPTPTGTPVIPINGGEEGGTPPEGAAPTVDPNATPTGTRVLESTAKSQISPRLLHLHLLPLPLQLRKCLAVEAYCRLKRAF